MNTSAMLMLILSDGVIAAVTFYFFWRVLRSQPVDHVDEDEANYPRGG